MQLLQLLQLVMLPTRLHIQARYPHTRHVSAGTCLQLVDAALSCHNGTLHATQQRLCKTRCAAAGGASRSGGQAGERRGWGDWGRRLAAGGLQREGKARQ